MKFFAVYDEYQLKLREAKRSFRTKWEGKKPNELSEAEAELYFKDAIALRKLEVQLMETYTVKLKPIIGMNRAIQLPRIEREVKKNSSPRPVLCARKRKVPQRVVTHVLRRIDRADADRRVRIQFPIRPIDVFFGKRCLRFKFWVGVWRV